MTRSFDVFDRDDFRNPDDPDRGTGGGSESFWSLRVRLGELHRKEERADARDREALDRSGRERPPLHREERVREILAQRHRSVFKSVTFSQNVRSESRTRMAADFSRNISGNISATNGVTVDF